MKVNKEDFERIVEVCSSIVVDTLLQWNDNSGVSRDVLRDHVRSKIAGALGRPKGEGSEKKILEDIRGLIDRYKDDPLFQFGVYHDALSLEQSLGQFIDIKEEEE